jgi:hypothetical protein
LDTFEGLIKRLIASLNASTLDYMFTGAVAASYYGTPRTTMDVDIIVQASTTEASAIADALTKAGIKPDERKIKAALTSDYRIVTHRDPKTHYAVDMILATEPLEKRAATIEGQPTYIQAPEALIPAKLRMIKATLPPERAQKDRDDVTAILRHTPVDVDQVKRRAAKEGTLQILEELLPGNRKQKQKRNPSTGRKP